MEQTTEEFMNRTVVFAEGSFSTTPAPAAKPSITDFAIYTVSEVVFKYGILVLGGIGTVGNSLALMVLSRKAFRTTTTSIFLRVLAVFDMLTLWSYVIWNVSDSFAPELKTVWLCKFLLWAMAFSPHVASYTLLIVALERLVAVIRPLHVREIFTRRKACIMSAVTILVILSYNSIYIVTGTVRKNSCNFEVQHRFLMAKWYYFDAAIGVVVPAVLICIINMATIGSFKHSQRMQAKMTKDAKQDTSKDKKEVNNVSSGVKSSRMAEVVSSSQVRLAVGKQGNSRQAAGGGASSKAKGQANYLTVMLIMISLTYWMLNIPSACFFIIQSNWNYRKSLETFARYILFYRMVYLLMLTNSSINFFMYAATGKKFRMELKAIFVYKPTPKNTSTNVSTTSTTDVS